MPIMLAGRSSVADGYLLPAARTHCGAHRAEAQKHHRPAAWLGNGSGGVQCDIGRRIALPGRIDEVEPQIPILKRNIGAIETRNG